MKGSSRRAIRFLRSFGIDLEPFGFDGDFVLVAFLSCAFRRVFVGVVVVMGLIPVVTVPMSVHSISISQ
jgi:hypothetical protein